MPNKSRCRYLIFVSSSIGILFLLVAMATGMFPINAPARSLHLVMANEFVHSHYSSVEILVINGAREKEMEFIRRHEHLRFHSIRCKDVRLPLSDFQYRMPVRCNCLWRRQDLWFRHRPPASTAPAPIRRPAASATRPPASTLTRPLPPGAPSAVTAPPANITEQLPAMDVKDSSGDPFAKITSTLVGRLKIFVQIISMNFCLKKLKLLTDSVDIVLWTKTSATSAGTVDWANVSKPAWKKKVLPK